MGGRINQRVDQVPTGDITEITVSNGVAGGGSSGSVALTLDTDAKGDLLVGTGADTAQKLSIGTNNYLLSVDTSTATGLAYVQQYAVLG